MINRRHCIKSITGAAFIAALPVSALAHREKTTVSDIKWNEDTQLLEIMHAYHMHDAETALAYIGVLERPDLTSLKARARLALYTQAHFNLTDLEGHKLPLELVGAEFEGRTVYVYQQAALITPPKGLIIDCSLLREIIEGQINNVDVNLSGDIHSLLFRDDDGPKKTHA